MIGYDFSIFWDTGRAILAGTNPYLVHLSLYPPAATYLFVVFGLLPFGLALPAWMAVSTVLLLHSLRKRMALLPAFGWLFYTPAIFNFLTGQLDALFFWLAAFLLAGGWKAAAAAALITLKPQLALVLLPWFLIRWLKTERPLLFKWIGLSLVLHLFPLVFDPNIYTKWLAALQGTAEYKMPLSSGIFGLVQLEVPIAILAVVGVAIVIWGLFQDELTARAALLLASPITIWYDDLLLAGSTPVWFLVPFSILVFLGSSLTSSSLPFLLIPLGVLAWRVLAGRKFRLFYPKPGQPAQ